MTEIMPFSPSDRELLVRLPWRVGMWVSSSDSDGGDEASAAEAEALAAIIVGFVSDSCKGELIQKLMEETVLRRAEWPSWSGDIDSVPEECRIAVDTLSGVLGPRDLASFKANMIEIGFAVASAWDEGEGQARSGMIAGIFSGMADSLARSGLWPFSGRTPSLDFTDTHGISTSERAALNRLAQSLEFFQGT